MMSCTFDDHFTFVICELSMPGSCVQNISGVHLGKGSVEH